METKRGKTWQSMSISNEVFDKLDVVRDRVEKEIGMRLSWTKFFGWILRKIEPAPQVKTVPVPAKPAGAK